jgi:hypothetical protein
LNTEKLEKEERTLESIMELKQEKRKVTLTTTEIHIARRIGKHYPDHIRVIFVSGI